jgi:hypothetical protein
MLRQVSLSLLPTIVPAAGYSLLASAFSLSVSTIIPDLIISKFNSWITNLRKQSNFVRFKILERYIKLKNRNYIIN